MEEKPLFELRPQIAVAIIPLVIGSIISGAIIGLLAGFYARSVTLGIIVFLVLIGITFFFRFMNLKARKYIFYKDRAEFYEGFLNIVRRNVRYQKVTDCVLVRTVWDRIFGTGTIRLVTAGHEGGASYYGRHSPGGGAAIQYIEHPEETFKKVDSLLKTH